MCLNYFSRNLTIGFGIFGILNPLFVKENKTFVCFSLLNDLKYFTPLGMGAFFWFGLLHVCDELG